MIAISATSELGVAKDGAHTLELTDARAARYRGAVTVTTRMGPWVLMGEWSAAGAATEARGLGGPGP